MRIESEQRARWSAMSADPARSRRIAAGRVRATAPRPLALMQAPAALQEPAPAPGLAELVRNDAGVARVDLYDEISWWGITAAEFSAALAEVQGDIQVNISSPGGDLFDALAIYSALKQRAGVVTVVIDGLAASAASVIAMAASPGRLFAAENATVMVHDALAVVCGNEQDHEQVAGLLGRESDNIAGIYAARSGRPVSGMRELMRCETWFVGGAEIAAAGLADSVLPDDGSPPAPGPWDALGAKLARPAQMAAGGAGRPGSPALRAMLYDRWSASSGRAGGRVSPVVSAVFGLGGSL